jgi:hypothetical protein
MKKHIKENKICNIMVMRNAQNTAPGKPEKVRPTGDKEVEDIKINLKRCGLD